MPFALDISSSIISCPAQVKSSPPLENFVKYPGVAGGGGGNIWNWLIHYSGLQQKLSMNY